MSDVAQMDRLPRNRRRRGRSRRRSRAASRSRGRKVFSRNKVGTIVSAQHRSDIHRFSNCKYICPPKLQTKRKIGGEGKESNLPSPTRRDRPVLKTGGATGPLPSPLRLMAPRWRPATLAGRPSYGKGNGARDVVSQVAEKLLARSAEESAGLAARPLAEASGVKLVGSTPAANSSV